MYASRFVCFSAGVYSVIGLSFKPVESRNEYNSKFKIADKEKPIDIISELHVSQQRIMN